MIKRIHHINFIVRDLEKALRRYKVLFGDPVSETESLPQRGVKLARFKVGEKSKKVCKNRACWQAGDIVLFVLPT
jgi:hypothetical protein